jgi:hypothetical protein
LNLEKDGLQFSTAATYGVRLNGIRGKFLAFKLKDRGL